MYFILYFGRLTIWYLISNYETWFLVDGSNATYHDFIRWQDAMDTCTRLNKSLPGINSDFLNTTLDKNNNTWICLAVYQTSSIVFRPVIKQVTNIDGITTVQPRNSTRDLPFLCRVNTGWWTWENIFYFIII